MFGCKSQPAIYQTSLIGSREDVTAFFKAEHHDTIHVSCGCFKGIIAEFRAKVLETHANNDAYRDTYLKEIEKAKLVLEGV